MWTMVAAWSGASIGFALGAWYGKWFCSIAWSRVLAEGTPLHGQTGVGVCLDDLDAEPDVVALVELEPGLYLLKLDRRA